MLYIYTILSFYFLAVFLGTENKVAVPRAFKFRASERFKLSSRVNKQNLKHQTWLRIGSLLEP